jgi:hypothetical protein
MKSLEMTVFERTIDWSNETFKSFVLSLARLEYLIEQGLLNWDSIDSDSSIPDLSSLVNLLSRERAAMDSLEIMGFMTGDRFVIDGVKIKAKKSFQESLYRFFCESLSTKRPSEFTFKNNAISVRWT